jgi:hypothetical protein
LGIQAHLHVLQVQFELAQVHHPPVCQWKDQLFHLYGLWLFHQPRQFDPKENLVSQTQVA